MAATTIKRSAEREISRVSEPSGADDSASPQAPTLLDYQQRLLEATAANRVVVCEKSRRIGATWGIGADAVLTAGAQRSAGGMDVFYIGYNLDMTREFIDTCAMWAKAFTQAAVEVQEFLFRDQAGDDSKDIQAFRIRFASDYEIVALCSRPRSLRGRQGYVIIDEAAFHDELEELLKAALALLIWGGKVLVISTHDGVDNVFNQLVQDIRAGKRPFALLTITFSDALGAGLYERVCLVTGKTWSVDAQATWEQEIRSFYGEGAAEELDCIPRNSGGKYLSRVLLESRCVPAPVLRWQVKDEFVDLSDEERGKQCADWFRETVLPLLLALPKGLQAYLGTDFGRSGDLTVFWPVVLGDLLKRRTPFIIELRNVPFREQEKVALLLCAGLPAFAGAALDARGNGQYLAERVRQHYGPSMVAEVMLSEGFYRDNWPKLKDALEDDRFELPAHTDVVDDFRTVEVVRGVPRIAERTGGKDAQRHGDTAIAALLAMFASLSLEGGPVEWSAEGFQPDVFGEARSDDSSGFTF